ncbi:YggS family pyridoxal phosphate-dependent enzyme [Berryella wangjianweii]|uniref:Pyridoxal phosphate homeostasis protein n=1 Tax=Berryella wangjianweii TaxID=2734634 RepID=A0A6M8J2C9_9ACTN|nr:YggS family pyridoxal phosphate-dependent enzyme [Berryella wangjianweii]QKF08080.1 YggS family pyridoxal phosphate-dependent enzyme [Berryella wangjianweii]
MGRYAQVATELQDVCDHALRPFESVCLVAVSKTVGSDQVAAAIAQGAGDFGENRPDALMEKQALFPQVRWHFIGNIQSRRIGDIVGRAALIHSLCQLKHAHRIDEVAAGLGIVQDVLIEVNVSGEESKSGVSPREVVDFARQVSELQHVRLRGLMTMAPQGDPQRAREVFEELAYLKELVCAHLSDEVAAEVSELSMGMSGDWREAVFAGATIVRIGRAVFSDESIERFAPRREDER